MFDEMDFFYYLCILIITNKVKRNGIFQFFQ